MPITIEMPRLSDTMEEGTLVKWHVSVGDKVASGDHLADVETDKATMELQAFDDGTVASLTTEQGQIVPVGQTILILAGEDETLEEAIAQAQAQTSETSDDQAAPAPAPEALAPTSTSTSAPSSSKASLRVSPLARKLAEEQGIDLTTLTGSGPGGRIIKRDILASPNTPPHAPAPGTVAVDASASPHAPSSLTQTPATLEDKTIPVTGMRKTIAKRLVESKTTVPHFQVSVAVHMDPLMTLRKTINTQLASQGLKLSINDFITRAVALACVQHPSINSSWRGDTIAYHSQVNVGVAVSLPPDKGGGLLVATVRQAHLKGLRQISEEVKALSQKARTVGLSLQEMEDSTITLSNLGMPQYGVTQFTAIVNPPNAAILAIGAALEKPLVQNSQLVVGHEMNVTLSGDHRVIDGASAAQYLATFRTLLENPAALLV